MVWIMWLSAAVLICAGLVFGFIKWANGENQADFMRSHDRPPIPPRA